jgi:hypothetical protein
LIAGSVVRTIVAMRSAIALMMLALALGACASAAPSYQDPPRASKIDRLRIDRDNCMLAKAPQLDDHGPDVRGVARRVAAACSDETDKLMALAVPYADANARAGFQQEAERRAADIVLTFRGVDNRPRVGDPTPLSK